MNFNPFSCPGKELVGMLSEMPKLMKELLMALQTQQELAAKLDHIKDTLAADYSAISTELATLNTKVSDLTAQVVATGMVTPEVDTALAGLQNSVDALTALVPPVPLP